MPYCKQFKNAISYLSLQKKYKAIGLVYNHLGPAEKLRLLCFFDVGFSTRLDGSSQGGNIWKMINEDLMHSVEEGKILLGS